MKSGEVDQVRDRHLAYFLGLTETAAPQSRGVQGAAWLARLERENQTICARRFNGPWTITKPSRPCAFQLNIGSKQERPTTI